MSCNSCENNCVQTLNVVSVPMDVADTNTVDLTLSGSILTADVINDPNGGLTSSAAGEAIKLDPNPCNGLSLSGSGLLAPAEHTSLYSDGGVVSPINILLTAPGSATYGSSGVVTLVNPSSCRSLTVYAFIFSSFSYITDPNVAAEVITQVSINGGAFTNIDDIDLSRNSAGTTFDSKSVLNRRYITIAPSSTATFEARQVFTYISGPGGARITGYGSGISTLGITQ
jgi:hypothetical protein